MQPREPLRSRAFRVVLVALVAAALGGALGSWHTSRRADATLQEALARSHASHEAELLLERLHAAATAADVAIETFLTTWRTSGLDAAAAAEGTVRDRFAVLRPALPEAADVAPLVREIDETLAERQAGFARLAEWARGGQFNRVREWAEAHREMLRSARLGQAIARLQESERQARERDRAALDAALRRSTQAARLSGTVQGGLGLLVLWLLWQHERARRLVIMCAWTRTIQHDGEWLTFEEYLRRRFGLETTHGIRPDQADRILADDQPPT